MASMTVRLIAVNGVMIGGGDSEGHFASLRALEKIIQPRTCATCIYAKFSNDKTVLACDYVKQVAPAWAIAFGCDNHDYLPF